MLSLAVIGLGRAGAARVRAIEGHPRARLAAIVRTRPGEGEWRFDQLLGEPIDGAIVCTPNALHAEAISALLTRGHHVATEFPVATSAGVARELFTLARERSRVLHVGHIELATPEHRDLRRRLTGLGRPCGGAVHFRGDFSGWAADDKLSGGPAVLASARLHRLIDLFGDARVVATRFRRHDEGYDLSVDLAFVAGGTTTLTESRSLGSRRETMFAVACEHGVLEAGQSDQPRRLFADDLDDFIGRIGSGAEPAVSAERESRVLELIEAIAAEVQAPPSATRPVVARPRPR